MTLKDKLTQKKTERLDVRVPTHLMDRVRSIVESSDANKSDVARTALEMCLPKIERELKLT